MKYTKIKILLLFLLALPALLFAEEGNLLPQKSNDLSGVWELKKDKNPNPREALVNAWKAQNPREKLKNVSEEGRFIETMSVFLFPYSDWIKVEHYKNGISINYAEGEFREYWTDEKNTPEFTGMIGATTAEWSAEGFAIKTVFKKEKMLVKESFTLSVDKQQLVNVTEIQWKDLRQPVLIEQVYVKKD